MTAPTFSFTNETVAFSPKETLAVVPVFNKDLLEKPVLRGFKDKVGQSRLVYGEKKTTLYVGIGDPAKFDETAARATGALIYNEATKTTFKKIALNTQLHAAEIADGILIESYTFDKYKTLQKPEDKKYLEQVTIGLKAGSAKAEEAAFAKHKAITESQFWASDLVNEPANVLNPETYASIISNELRPLGVKIDILTTSDIRTKDMNALRAVGKGSVTPPCLVVMEYDGTAGSKKAPVALVGKGLTFDAGGISIKPADGMDLMKMDMAGSAAVVGAMRAMALTKTDAKVVAVVALAENMTDANSYRPGDIITTLNGKTVFVDNTDAEGRLVLADAMTYVQRTYKPRTVVDLATLTGAAKAALGTKMAAFFTNNDGLWKAFDKASKGAGENVWRMPLTKDFTDAVRKTPTADLTNSAGTPGACTAAAFLEEFVEKKTKWAHIDMAGPGIWSGSERRGWGVRLLTQAVKNGL